MHEIQRHILHRLTVNPVLRYSRIKPKELDGNLFMYHLGKLIDEQLVVKNDAGTYQLSEKGLKYADRLSLVTNAVREQPKIVTMIVCQNEEGNYLLYHWTRQPKVGLISFPYGKLHLDEDLTAAARRELKEKANLETELTYRGTLHLRMYRSKQLLADEICYIFSGQNPQGELITTEVGEPFWQELSADNLGSYAVSVREVYQLLQQHPNQLFFQEVSAHL